MDILWNKISECFLSPADSGAVRSPQRMWDYTDKPGLLDRKAEKIAIVDHINVSLYKQALDDCQAEHGEESPKSYEILKVRFSKNKL